MTGSLLLELENKDGKTAAKHVYFQGALKVMRPIYLDDSGQVCYYLLNPGGGYVDGDEYEMKFVVHERAKATLTTQSATKIYKTPTKPVVQITEISLKENSFLEFLVDPLIAYSQAKYKQKTVIQMDKSASLLYTDLLTPGWSKTGKRFDYDWLQLKNEIYVDGELAVYDHVKLSPSEQEMNRIGFMEGFTHLGSMIVVDEKVNDEFIEELYELINLNAQHYKAALSMLAVHGFSLRILAHSTQVIEQIMMDCREFIYKRWFGSKPSELRKY